MKNKYRVKLIKEFHYNDTSNINVDEIDLGITYAVSESKAISNIKFREKIYNSMLGEFYIYNGYKLLYLKAFLE